MSQILKTGEAAFEPRARLLKLIGEELISDEVVALAELIKNAHDADATEVHIEFRDARSGHGDITVRDNGTGMNLEAFLDSWMQPARSLKRREGHQKSPRGRRVLGEKGVGRFAADKVASRLQLVSRAAGESTELIADFCWDKFDTDDLLLSEITSKWYVTEATEIPSQGTILRMTGLRVRWNERMFRRLSAKLGRLVSPSRGKRDFRIHIVSDEFPDYSRELTVDFLSKAPYSIKVGFDGDFNVEVGINGRPSTVHPWNGHRDLRCGPVRIHLRAFDLEPEALARIGPRMEVRSWLKTWTGISIYRDGFRIWPYGEPHDDWLGLDQRRVNNPVLRLSTNQVIGFVEISRDENPALKDQTSREGLVTNDALTDLRSLLLFVLQLLESERHHARHPDLGVENNLAARATDPQISLVARLERLAEKLDGEQAHEARRIAKLGATILERQQEFEHQYSELAGLGTAAERLHSILAPIADQIQEEATKLDRLVDGRKDREVNRSVQRLIQHLSPLRQRIQLLEGIEHGAGGNRRRTIDVLAELKSLQNQLRPLTDDIGAHLSVANGSGELIRCEIRPENFGRIFHILTSNSLDWVRLVKDRRINVTARPSKRIQGAAEIIFGDTGPGIPAALANKIFAAGFSTREGGRGMGLTIARAIAKTHGGDLEVILDGRRRGAAFRLTLPRKLRKAQGQRRLLAAV